MLCIFIIIGIFLFVLLIIDLKVIVGDDSRYFEVSFMDELYFKFNNIF